MKKQLALPLLCLTVAALAAGCVRTETETRPAPVVQERVIEREKGSDVDVRIHDYR
jgi:hypothetical protein